MLSKKPFIRKEVGGQWIVYRRTGTGHIWVWAHKECKKAWEKYMRTIEGLRKDGMLWEVFP